MVCVIKFGPKIWPVYGEIENSESSENIFPRFSTPSFPFCTLPKTENLEMKASEFSLRHFDQTLRFSNSKFSILHHTKTEKLELKTLEFSLRSQGGGEGALKTFSPHSSDKENDSELWLLSKFIAVSLAAHTYNSILKSIFKL